jgi:hypothetical protein
MRLPSLSLHGIEGAFAGPGAKTVIPAKVGGKFSIRWVILCSLFWWEERERDVRVRVRVRAGRGAGRVMLAASVASEGGETRVDTAEEGGGG